MKNIITYSCLGCESDTFVHHSMVPMQESDAVRVLQQTGWGCSNIKILSIETEDNKHGK